MKRRKSIRPYPNNHEQIGILASLALHALLIVLLLDTRAPASPAITAIEVSIEPPNRYQQQRPQIVSPSNAPPQKPPEDTTRLSDSDSRAEVEKIQRGDGGGIPGKQSDQQPSKPQETAPRAAKQKPDESKRSTNRSDQERPPVTQRDQPDTPSKRDLNLKDLTLDDSTLALKFGNTPKNQAAAKPPSASSPSTMSLSDYQAFSRPQGSGATFFGSAGISDLLPNLPDGDITLLNAKANIYASFVRRVAIQVFTQLRSQGWERLSAQQIRQLTGFATVEAVLTPEGKFIRAQIIESSGSDAFDTVLFTSASKGASDPNPPPGALAKDGTIRFIFKARSWSQIGASRRSGAPIEQRWLLLSTGLE